MKKKILFTDDAYIGGKLFAKEGDIKEFDDSKGSATRWINRGHKEVCEDTPVKESELEEVKEEEVKEESKEIETAPEESGIDLDSMSKKELLRFAKGKEIDIPKDVKKVDEIRNFLKEKDEAIEDAF